MKKNIFISVLVGILFFIPVAVHAASGEAPVKDKKEKIVLKTYTDSFNKFKIKLPKTWIIKADPEGQVKLLATEKKLGEEQNRNVNITHGTSEVPFEQDLEDVRTQLPNVLENMKFLEDKEYKVPHAQARLFSSEFEIDGTRVRNIQLFVRKDDMVYVATATSGLETWKADKKLYQKILKTFRVL